MHIYIYIYIYVCVCVCVCVWELRGGGRGGSFDGTTYQERRETEEGGDRVGFVRLAGGWCGFVQREKCCWQVDLLREKYCWLISQTNRVLGGARVGG
jgi:hypothetical protein